MSSVLRPMLALLVAGGLIACDKTDSSKKKIDKDRVVEGDKVDPKAKSPTSPTAPKVSPIESGDMLARTEVATEVDVKHVLLGWKELAGAYRGRMDPRAKKRTEADASKLATDLAAKLRANPKQIDALVKQHSEDPGSLAGKPYTVNAKTPFMPKFKQLALRLKLNEVGIVQTSYGYHVMVRVTPPPPDPLESSKILARPAVAASVHVRHVLIGWKDVPAAKQKPQDPRASKRSKADADNIAKSVLDKIVAGKDMKALMKKFSEDPGSKDNGQAYPVSANTRMVEPFKKLSMRLQLGEAGMVISPFGWHVIKRVDPPPPPPPDSLESSKILARTKTADKTKVKHILLGWTEANTGHPVGSKRTRAELEKLVKKTVASLRKGAPIEPFMAKLSEDPGSAKTGKSYDASPKAGLVPPFKALSLRLKKDEVGVVKTQFGIHIIKRVE